MKNFNIYYRGSQKNLIFSGRGVKKTSMYRGIAWKGGFGQFSYLKGAILKTGVGGSQVDTPMSTMWFFAKQWDHRTVTCLGNVCQLNWKARQKAGYKFVTETPSYLLTYLLTCLLTYLLTCMFWSSFELSYCEEKFSTKENFDGGLISTNTTNITGIVLKR